MKHAERVHDEMHAWDRKDWVPPEDPFPDVPDPELPCMGRIVAAYVSRRGAMTKVGEVCDHCGAFLVDREALIAESVPKVMREWRERVEAMREARGSP